MDLLTPLKMIESQFSVLKIGDKNINNIEKIKESFGIASNEIILAYIPNGNLLTSFFSDVAFIITDKATYKKKSILGKIFKSNNDNRVVYTENLSEYVAYSDGMAIDLKSKDSKIRYYVNGFTDHLRDKTEVLKELLQIIACIQQEQCKIEKNKKSRQNTVEWLKKMALDEIFEGQLQDCTKLMIDSVRGERDFACDMYEILLKNSALKCDTLALEEYALESGETLEQRELVVLEKLVSEQVTVLLNRIEDLSQNIDADFLKKTTMLIESNDEKRRTDNSLTRDIGLFSNVRNNMLLMESYVFLRFNPQIESKKVTNRIMNISLESKRVAKLINSSSYLKNQMMLPIYDNIKNGYCEKNVVHWIDSLGIGSMYYAIALKNVEAIRACLYSANGNNPYSYYDKDFGYCTAAMYVGVDEKIIEEIFMETDSWAKSCQVSINSINRQISIKEKVIELAHLNGGATSRKMNNAKENGEDDVVEQCREELYQLKVKVQLNEAEIEELLSLQEDILNDIQETFGKTMEKCEIEVQNIKNSSDSKIRILKTVLDTPEFISKYLNAPIQDYVCFIYKNQFLSMPSFLHHSFYKEVDLFDTVEKKHDFSWVKGDATEEKAENEKEEKLFGDSWFSPEAHKEMKKLYAEYKELAKMYHPDNFNGRQDIFVEIQEERNRIMENFEK